jgi:hypothetical protein
MRNHSLITFCLVVGLLSAGTPAFAADNPGPTSVAADLVVARPVGFLATVLGSALFVVALPVAALSHSVQSTAQALVVKPAQATFTRPLGNFDDLKSN